MTPFAWPRRAALALFLMLFSFFMLTASREQPWSDGTPIWQVAESLIDHGDIDVSKPWPPHIPKGRGDKYYALAPLVQSLVHLPGAALHKLIAATVPQARWRAWPFCAHLAPSALGALTCLLFLGILRRQGISRPAALSTTALLAGGTTVWLYARYPYSEILQAACFTGFLGQILEVRRAPARRAALALGLWAGLLIACKPPFLLSVVAGAVLLAWWLRPRWRTLLEVFGWAALTMVPFAALMLLHNWLRWGSPFQTGYDLKVPIHERLWWGLWGLFFSPGKSVFLYSPPLLLTLVALPRAWLRARQLLIATLALAWPVIHLHAGYLYWSGDYAWGPRYLVFAVPVLLLPAALLVEDALGATAWRRRVALASIASVAGAGLLIQLLGCAFHWDHFIRVQREARMRWLGAANTGGTPFPDFGGVCGACFEDMHGQIWLPPFHPIEGHAWLARHVIAEHDWIEAEADAPWRRYTSLRLDIAHTYRAARIDWWYLEFVRDPSATNRAIGGLLLVLMLGGVGAGWWWVRRALRQRFVVST